MKLNYILPHLLKFHKIGRGPTHERPSSEANVGFIKYISDYFGNPRCACGCSKEVGLHNRKIQFNLFADDCLNKGRFLNPTCAEFHLFKGKSVEETLNTISAIQTRKYGADVCEKNSQRNRGELNTQSMTSMMLRTGKSEEEIHKKLKIKSKGKNNGFYGKTHTDEVKCKLAVIRANQSKMVSKPELIMWGALKVSGINFKYQKAVGPYVVDYILDNKIIVEVYGDYWHSDKVMGGRKKERDNKKEQYLIDNGYELIIAWESEVISDKLINVVNRIKDAKNQKNK